MSSQHVLVSGATGYIGGRLVPCLLERGHRVRCMARSPEQLRGRPWADDVEIVQGDALQADSLRPAMAGIDTAYYLIHSLSAGEEEFVGRDRRAADNFGRAARDQGVGRIIYLGGLEPKGQKRSKHLQSRIETGQHLRQWGVPVTEFRAAVIVGSGSLSFEIIRHLTERLPVMISPIWVQTPTQPIAVRDVLNYLVEALDVPESAGEIIEIGGPDVLTYGDMFRIYAKVRGLRRLIINVPLLTPRLSSHWVGLVTPLSNKITRPLIEGLDNEATVGEPEKARRLFSVKPIPYEAAVRRALRRFTEDAVPTAWHDTRSSFTDAGPTEELEITEGMIKETRQLTARATPAEAFAVIKQLGGKNGWLYADALWHLRGFLDLLFGGIGYRKGRRSPTDLRVGDAVDFWRVEAFEPNRLLRLRAEMKVSGKAWLQFELTQPNGLSDDEVLITQTALFEPKGLWGLVYWYLLYIPHRFIFKGMIRELARRAEVLNQQPARADTQEP